MSPMLLAQSSFDRSNVNVKFEEWKTDDASSFHPSFQGVRNEQPEFRYLKNKLLG